MNAHEEAMQIWKYLEPMVERKIRDAMAPAVRRKNFEVAAAPNGTTIGVREPGSSKVINIPYPFDVSPLERFIDDPGGYAVSSGNLLDCVKNGFVVFHTITSTKHHAEKNAAADERQNTGKQAEILIDLANLSLLVQLAFVNGSQSILRQLCLAGYVFFKWLHGDSPLASALQLPVSLGVHVFISSLC